MANVSLTTILYAAAGGIIPTFLWLWFWLTEENDHAEPTGLLILTFIGGAIGVLLLLPLKPVVIALALEPRNLTILYAFLEECIKYFLVSIIAFHRTVITRATDYTIFLVTGALGFSALENTLYLIEPIHNKLDLGSILITGNMRFLGATVLHSVSVALVGVLMGLGFTSGRLMQTIYAIIGIMIGTGLHTVFNYFIMQDTRQSMIIAIAGVWIVAVIVVLLFDRLRAFTENVQENASGNPLSQ